MKDSKVIKNIAEAVTDVDVFFYFLLSFATGSLDFWDTNKR